MTVSFKEIAILSCLCLLASCAHKPVPGPVTGQSVQPQTFAPDMVAGNNDNIPPASSARRKKFNVPSAPLTTPLCGSALQEQAQTGQKIYAQSLASGNNCSMNACFQPLTGVYISQTGNPVVCR